MAKSKSPLETVQDYFSSIKYFEDAEESRMIVMLPEGLGQKKIELKDKKLKLALEIEGLDNFVVIGDFVIPVGIKEVLVLNDGDAKMFGVVED